MYVDEKKASSLDDTEFQTLENELSHQRLFRQRLEERIADISNFTYSEQAKKLLEAENATGDDHDERVAALKAEREERIALVKELDRLNAEKDVLKNDIASLAVFYDKTIPSKLKEFSKSMFEIQNTFQVPYSRQVIAMHSNETICQAHAFIQTLFMHFTCYLDAQPLEQSKAKVRLRPVSSYRSREQKEQQFVLELEFEKKKGVFYFLKFKVFDNAVAMEVSKGPNMSNVANAMSLVNLFPNDVGSVKQGSFRCFDWIDRICKQNDTATVTTFFANMERRCKAQTFLIPQIDLLNKLEVLPITVSGVRLKTASKLIAFNEQQPDLIKGIRKFSGKIDFEKAPVVLHFTMALSSEYPSVKPCFSFDLMHRSSGALLTGQTSNAVMTYPSWTTRLMAEKPMTRSCVSDPVLVCLEESINKLKGPRDSNFDLSSRMAKCLLGFDLYCFAELGMESARYTWNMVRANQIGKERRIDCEELK